MSYLNEGQLTTDQDTRKLGHMFIIPFPVLCKCRNQLKRTKTTKNFSKDDIKKSKDDIIAWFYYKARAYTTVVVLVIP